MSEPTASHRRNVEPDAEPRVTTDTSGTHVDKSASGHIDKSPEADDARGRRLARASVWMALGTIASRLSGFVRLALLAWTIGTALDADLFNNANTIPNTMYILVAGGIFNVVLVPQLVRAMRGDEDGGDAYANRVITLGLMVLAIATALLVLAVPLVLRLVFKADLFTAQFAAQRESAELLMYLCMPQVFFYGAFVLIGQVLNARERFGPMMWAPVVNNVVACGIIVGYLIAFGSSNGTDGFTDTQALLLGIGSTAGIAIQALLLVPFLRRAGFRYRPRFDLRGVGLGHTARLAAWTLGFIVANQIAFITINRIATGGTLSGAATNEAAGGSAVYEIGFLVSQVPHGVITVSLATAIIPMMSAHAAAGEYERVRVELARTLRMVLAIVAPLAVAVGVLGIPAAGAISIGALSENHEVVGRTVAAFSLAMIAFTIHYMMLRGFYADEDTRTPFFIQVVVALSNITFALVLTQSAEPAWIAAMLALSYGLAYVVGAILSVTLLSRRIGSLVDREMLTFVARLVASCAVAAIVMIAIVLGLDRVGLEAGTPGPSIVIALAAGIPGAAAYLVTARLLRMEQLGYLVSTLRRR
ncbi:murein biosynthesis integral membrane protein MurJ [Aeromicrobium sp. CF3.5]|uniref:murein biosynthesis integral membrane protein MurJ n=1 Tax=Aeromicrobium sp. CF3.5 TaxID=3373078 RepID=UPI003EE5A25A